MTVQSMECHGEGNSVGGADATEQGGEAGAQLLEWQGTVYQSQFASFSLCDLWDVV